MTPTPLLLTQPRRPVFQIAAPPSPRRDTLFDILYSRFLSWLRKASLQAIGRAITTVSTLLLISLAVMAPHFALGLAVSTLTWNGYKIPIFLAACALTLNARRIWRWARRLIAWRRKAGDEGEAANQHMFLGVPVDELAEWLVEKKAFKVQEALDHFKFSQRKYNRIADELEKHGVLIRGENNARVLAPISYAELATQLRDDFPLVWDHISRTWVAKDDAYGRFLREREQKEKKQSEQTARKERKIERLDRKIEAKKEELEGVAELELVEGVPSAFAQALAYANNGAE